MANGDNAQVIRLVLVEDESLFRDLLRVALSQYQDIEVLETFATGAAALDAVPHLSPHVAILDIDLGGSPNGVQVGIRLRRQMPDLGIVLLSNYGDPEFVASLPREVTSGWSYLLKTAIGDTESLVRAIRGAAAGLVVLDRDLVSKVQQQKNSHVLNKLTSRQREILELIAQGFTNAAIAEKLVISVKSVENQINALYQELEIDRTDSSLQPRVKAVLLYLQESSSTAVRRSPTQIG